MNSPRYIIPLFLLVLLPTTVSANSGSALMIATFFHMFIGNALIGILEGLLLSWIFKCSKWKSMGILILANYASAWAGAILITGYLTTSPDFTIENIRIWFFVFIAAAFLLTLLIEFSFFRYVLRKNKLSFRKMMSATILINSISYLFLIGWYWAASGTFSLIRLDVVTHEDLTPPDPYELYYLSPKGDQLIRMDLSSFKSEQVTPELEFKASDPGDCLVVRENRISGFDLLLATYPYNPEERNEPILLTSFTDRFEHNRVKPGEFTYHERGTLHETSDWEFKTSSRTGQGLRGISKKTGKRMYLPLITPITTWDTSNATHLAGDYVVFQLGDDQICILHPESNRIALIARGKGPVVVRPKTSK